MIYNCSDTINKIQTFFCPDQSTIDEGKAIGYTGTFIIGTKTDADNLLNSCRQNWFDLNTSLFSVNKDIDPDPIQTTWVVCDLNVEPQNIDVNYNIFDVINGYYTLVIGLDNAKNLLQTTENNAKEFFILDYVSWDVWQPLPKTK